ncbi:hypothetical protein H6P81_009882 [Aristolochia fimbriata]|uniref:Uncharacterized protein n=1 Tax=Aristolochia fimbriata TaxID=158543 RepID=A0AAV7EM66_ARIFI|nr:hypothetical protein H6P81_009882 [Aristolochia fimbriata]
MAISTRCSFAWSGLSPYSHYRLEHLKSSFLWQHLGGQRNELQNLIGTQAYMLQLRQVGASRSVADKLFSLKRNLQKRQLICFATAEDEISDSELNLAATELEKLDPSGEDVNLEIDSDIFVERSGGKPGLISFYGLSYKRQDEVQAYQPQMKHSNLVWFVGPAVLVASLVLPSLYLRKILSTIFEDSLLTDFLILFFTEALFYGGVAVFLMLVDHVQRPLQLITSRGGVLLRTGIGPRISSVATLVLSLLIPLVTMGLVWPWTGPAASATLAPYLVGIVVQFAFERYTRYQKSPAWPVIPVIFQVYRLHQLNRAAQLVTALSFSVRGAETTSQTLAINSSLGTLLNVLQFLGVICIWSLSSFLMRFFPSSPIAPDP